MLIGDCACRRRVRPPDGGNRPRPSRPPRFRHRTRHRARGLGDFARGFGLADVANKTPLSPRTPLLIGSTTKAFTAMLVDECGSLRGQRSNDAGSDCHCEDQRVPPAGSFDVTSGCAGVDRSSAPCDRPINWPVRANGRFSAFCVNTMHFCIVTPERTTYASALNLPRSSRGGRARAAAVIFAGVYVASQW
jgi:hypothetical protein